MSGAISGFHNLGWEHHRHLVGGSQSRPQHLAHPGLPHLRKNDAAATVSSARVEKCREETGRREGQMEERNQERKTGGREGRGGEQGNEARKKQAGVTGGLISVKPGHAFLTLLLKARDFSPHFAVRTIWLERPVSTPKSCWSQDPATGGPPGYLK